MTTTIGGTTGVTFPDATTQNTSPFPGGLAFRNRIINGAMMIDQRNAGAAITVNGGTNQYSVDRFYGYDNSAAVFTLQQSSTAPTGFTKSLLATVTTADASLTTTERDVIVQVIEGYNVADLAWGTASAATVTLSFWVRSSLTGSFGGSLMNDAENRSYPFQYTISAANTWEQKTITIAGDTTGTWLTTNGAGIQVVWSLGVGPSLTGTANTWAAAGYRNSTGSVNLVGTLGATFYVTGVQLEKGSTATSFDYRPYGTELVLCYRYAQPIPAVGLGYANGTNLLSGGGYIALQPMRASPTLSIVPTYGVNTGSAGTVGLRYATPNGVSIFNASNNWSGNPDVNISTAGLVASEL